MANLFIIFLLSVASLALTTLFAVFAFISHIEREQRAFRVSIVVAALCCGGFVAVLFLPAWVQITAALILMLVLTVMLVAFILPIGKVTLGNDSPSRRIDERDIPFARARLMPGSLAYGAYYAMRPEHKVIDDRFRSKPGLLSPKARLANPFHFASSEGSFWLTESLREAVDGPVSSERYQLSPVEITVYIKNLTRYFGALDVGITELKPYHVYTNIGRGSGKYGDEISLDHNYAIAFTVEMDFTMIGSSPASTVIMESAKQYVDAARVAVQLAGAIRYLGYPARAHIDGNYRVIAPLVARDAGLGEIGRMGILMTPNQGARVRLGVVTTNMELIPDDRWMDLSVLDFCSICNKCALNCPSKSIPNGDRQEIDGVLRWKIDSDNCFYYWNIIGTDCAKCIMVCPYSHPNSFIHKFVRWGNRRSGAFRRAALKLDDLFYGVKPDPRRPPEWTVVDNP